MNTKRLAPDEHPFDLNGLMPMQQFLGCISCGFQLPVGAVAARCECGKAFQIYTMTHEDCEQVWALKQSERP